MPLLMRASAGGAILSPRFGDAVGPHTTRCAMGLMPAGAKNPFTRIDAQSVIGALKATGSRDPDVLHAQKQELLAPYSHLKLLGIIGMVCGAFFTVTFILAIVG